MFVLYKILFKNSTKLKESKFKNSRGKMESSAITDTSRFGRLRKISTKLIDLPNRSTSKVKECSPSIKQDLRRKKTTKGMVDPFVDFRPEIFNELLPSDESTDTSSEYDNSSTDTSSECDESMVMNLQPSTGTAAKQRDIQNISETKKVFS